MNEADKLNSLSQGNPLIQFTCPPYILLKRFHQFPLVLKGLHINFQINNRNGYCWRHVSWCKPCLTKGQSYMKGLQSHTTTHWTSANQFAAALFNRCIMNVRRYKGRFSDTLEPGNKLSDDEHFRKIFTCLPARFLALFLWFLTFPSKIYRFSS